jgi:hypothetical protein
MVKGNTICFGYGDILVGYSFTGILLLKWISPAVNLEEYIDSRKVEILKIIQILLVDDDYHYIFNMLQNVKDRKINSFKFHDYIFDFSNYNEKSVNIVERGITAILQYLFMCAAC